MNTINKFREDRENELANIVKLIMLYTSLYDEEKDAKCKKFYKYSINLAITQANEIMGGSVKLNTQYRDYFELAQNPTKFNQSKLQELEEQIDSLDDEEEL
jgi:hypothetical protein